MTFGRLSFALAIAVVCVCSASMSQAQKTTVTGKLSRVMAIGGESTGWAIQLDSETLIPGKQLRSIELQPGDVRILEAMENKHVSTTGKIVRRSGVERGERTVLTISSIEEIKPKANLTGTNWVLENLAGRRPMDKVKATLTFPEAGKVSGNGSCNRFFGSVQVGDGVIKLDPLGSTRMACPEPVMYQESTYLKALQAAERYEVSDFKLLLYSKGFVNPLRFVKNTSARTSRK